MFPHNYTFHFAPTTSALIQRTATREAKLVCIYLSRWRELNPRPHPYQGCALPLSYIGVPCFLRAEDGAQTRGPQLGRLMLYRLSYFRNPKWVEMDSNHRSDDAADLQSAPFGHSGIYPKPFKELFLSLLSDSNQRPRDYKSRALAN